MKNKITFTKSAAPFILRAFGVKENSSGILIDETTNEPILTPEGDELTLKTFGGIVKNKDGNPSYLKNDLLSVIKLVDGDY